MAGAALAQAPERPKIVLILSDDLTARDLGGGNPVVRTPNLEPFARQGMRFTRAFTAAPQCVSPVAAWMGRFHSLLPRELKVFPECLRGAGSDTNAIYEWHALRTFHERMDLVDRTGAPRTKTSDSGSESGAEWR